MRDVSSVVVTGPLSPVDVADLLDPSHRRIALCIPGYRGIPTSELVRALVAAGVAVEVVTNAEEVDSNLELTGPGLRLLVAPRRPRPRDRALDLFRAERRSITHLLCSAESPLVHAHWTYEFAWAAQSTRKPVLVTAHDAPLTILRETRDAYRAIRYAMAVIVRSRLTDLVAVSPYLATRWRREMLYRRQIDVIPNFVPHFTGPYDRPRRDDETLLVIAAAGPMKNVSVALEATAELRRRGRPARIVLVGPGLDEGEPLAAAWQARNSERWAEFRGPLDRASIAQLLSSAAVLVHPSREESFGLSVVEAMNVGLPVVAGSSSGAVPWLLDHGKAGVLVDVTRASDVADGIARLLSDSGLAASIAAAARDRVSTTFSSDSIVDAYLSRYALLRKGTS